jgi:hypothetical protein
MDELDGMRSIGVNAETVGMQGNLLPIDAGDAAVQDSHSWRSTRCSVCSSAPDSAWDQCSVGAVGTVGEGLLDNGQPNASATHHKSRSSQGKEKQPLIE